MKINQITSIPGIFFYIYGPPLLTPSIHYTTKTFTKSLGGAWPPRPPLATPLVQAKINEQSMKYGMEINLHKSNVMTRRSRKLKVAFDGQEREQFQEFLCTSVNNNRDHKIRKGNKNSTARCDTATICDMVGAGGIVSATDNSPLCGTASDTTGPCGTATSASVASGTTALLVQLVTPLHY